MAGLLLVMACGVPMPEEHITATTIAEEQARTSSPRNGDETSASNTFFLTPLTDALEHMVGNDTREDSLETRPPTTATSEQVADEAGELEAPSTESEDAVTEDEATGTVTPEAEETAEATATAGPETVQVATLSIEPGSEGLAAQFLELLNDQRSRRGLTPLAPNGTMAAVATSYAQNMAQNRFFDHNGLDGSSPAGRLSQGGYGGLYWGEALAGGQSTPMGALNALLASPPHAAILLDPQAVEIGVGHAHVAGSPMTHYWVVMTAIP